MGDRLVPKYAVVLLFWGDTRIALEKFNCKLNIHGKLVQVLSKVTTSHNYKERDMSVNRRSFKVQVHI
jgi:hypothetical protein